MLSEIQGLRKEYRQASLNEGDLLADPFLQFKHWFEQALSAQLPEPNAMILSTVSASGAPSSRTVLLKELDPQGFVFFSNYASRKGREVDANPQVCLLFYWPELERQIRIEGPIEKIAEADSDAYFASRPRGSQLGAWASMQSARLNSREELEQVLQRLEQDYVGKDIPRPPHWGGYRVVPEAVEFWQGRPSRLHDRLLYRQQGQTWSISRLSP
ncbi:MAG: pyridoxamine 5'-phosphate oxidase [Candidatus Sericytochromatia bacterium]